MSTERLLHAIVRAGLENRFVVAARGPGARGASAGGPRASCPIDAVPDVTNVQVQILTSAPALGPVEVERFITFPVETR